MAILCTTTFYAKQILRSTYTIHLCVLHGSQKKNGYYFHKHYQLTVQNKNKTQLYFKQDIILCNYMF